MTCSSLPAASTTTGTGSSDASSSWLTSRRPRPRKSSAPPATPGVGIVILSMVLASVGIPATGIALIMGVDRILDMSRTAINVSGDLVASKVMDRWVGAKASLKDELIKQEMTEEIRKETGEDVLTADHLRD